MSKIDSQPQVVEVRPRLGGFLVSYVLFSLPGFISGLIWLLVSTILLFAILIAFVGSGAEQQAGLEYDVLSQNDNTDEAILIYDLQGPIMVGSREMGPEDRLEGIYTELVAKDFEAIKKDDNIKTVVFRVNTPGGMIFASEILGDQIEDLMNAKGQEQAVYYYDMIAASGGLWATYKSENYIVGNPYGETGSVGVLIAITNYKELADKVGYKQEVIKSSDTKDIGNPLKEMSPAERKYLQEQVDKSYNRFVDLVSESRGLPRDKVLEFATGLTYDNETAKEFGMIDEVGQLDKATSKAASNAGLDNYDILQLKAQSSLFGSFSGESFLANMLGIPQNAQRAVDRSTFFEPGMVYAIDESKI
jgi:signal peptide peptidase SppA